EHARQGAADQDQEADPVKQRQLLMIVESCHGASVVERDDDQCAAEGEQSHDLQRAVHLSSSAELERIPMKLIRVLFVTRGPDPGVKPGNGVERMSSGSRVLLMRTDACSMP